MESLQCNVHIGNSFPSKSSSCDCQPKCFTVWISHWLLERSSIWASGFFQAKCKLKHIKIDILYRPFLFMSMKLHTIPWMICMSQQSTDFMINMELCLPSHFLPPSAIFAHLVEQQNASLSAWSNLIQLECSIRVKHYCLANNLSLPLKGRWECKQFSDWHSKRMRTSWHSAWTCFWAQLTPRRKVRWIICGPSGIMLDRDIRNWAAMPIWRTI